MDIRVQFNAEAALRAMERAPNATVNHVRQALREACRLVQRGAREAHRFKPRTGALERAIRYRVNLAKCEGVIDIDPAVAPYGVYVHEPTGIYGPRGSKYEIKAKNKQFLRFIGAGGQHVFRRKVMHPGTPADQFLYKSAERNHGEINRIFARHTDAALREAGLL